MADVLLHLAIALFIRQMPYGWMCVCTSLTVMINRTDASLADVFLHLSTVLVGLAGASHLSGTVLTRFVSTVQFERHIFDSISVHCPNLSGTDLIQFLSTVQI